MVNGGNNVIYLEADTQNEMHAYFIAAAGADVFKMWLRTKWIMAYSAQNYGAYS